MKKLFFLAFIVFFFLPLPSNASEPFSFPLVYPTAQRAIILYDEKTKQETLIYSPSFEGRAKDFGLIIPVPSKPQVTSNKELFKTLLLVEKMVDQASYSPPSEEIPALFGPDKVQIEALTKKVESQIKYIEKKSVDIYQIKVIQAKDEKALSLWLSENNYRFSKLDHPLLKEYLRKGQNWYFVLAKINLTAFQSQFSQSDLLRGDITPLKIVFKSEKPFFPLKLLKLSTSQATQDILYSFSFEISQEGFYVKMPFFSPSVYPTLGPLKSQPPGKVYISPPYSSKPLITITDSEAYHGEVSLKFPVDRKGIAIVRSGLYLKEQSIPYTLSFYLKQKDADNAELKVKVLNGELPISKILRGRDFSDWKRVVLTFTAEASTIEFRIKVLKPANGEFFLDAFQLEKGNTATKFAPSAGTSYQQPSYNPPKSIALNLYLFTKGKIDPLSLTSLSIQKEVRLPSFAIEALFNKKESYRLTYLASHLPSEKIHEDIYFEFKKNKLIDISSLKILALIVAFITLDIIGIAVYLKRR